MNEAGWENIDKRVKKNYTEQKFISATC